MCTSPVISVQTEEEEEGEARGGAGWGLWAENQIANRALFVFV